jgi:adenine-specific DNA-methyltransferase
MEKITTDHPLSHSADIVKQNIEALKALFPTINKEGRIDIEELTALLGDDVETNEDYYRFTWAGKSISRREANKPSTATLRPNKDESKNWDATQNVFIEGDNLEVLKLLQKSYANAVKMIYIDPPYNTGKDFVYKDNYADNLGNYLTQTKQSDEEGRKLNTNTESDGRYHSNWLNMIYPRLKLCRTLLKEDGGVIFISIDDNEVQNLRKVCDEIFGEENFIEQIVWKKKYGGGAKTKYYVGLHEYVLCYARNITTIASVEMSYDQSLVERYYKYKDEKAAIRGPYRLQPLATNSNEERTNLRYPILFEGREILPEKQWQWSRERTETAQRNNELVIVEKDGKYSVNFKQYLRDENGEERTSKPFSIVEGIYTQHGTNEIKELFGDGKMFDFPKPTGLIKALAQPFLTTNDLILDFFAGSGTTADAIIQLNAEDGGKRKFICVQLDVQTEIDSEAYKAGYKKISEVTIERIKRAGERSALQIKEGLFDASKSDLDIGFKAFKLDSSNIRAWDVSPESLETNLFNANNNIKDGRSEVDIMYEVLLKYGMDLSTPIEEKLIAGKTVYNVGAGALFVCLADGVGVDIAEGIATWKQALDPSSCKVIFKDTGFTDVTKTNSVQILKRHGITDVNTI